MTFLSNIIDIFKIIHLGKNPPSRHTLFISVISSVKVRMQKCNLKCIIQIIHLKYKNVKSDPLLVLAGC